MYQRIVGAFIFVLASVIAAGLLREHSPPQQTLVSTGDGGLGRRIDHLSFDQVPRSRAFEEVRTKAGINLVTNRELNATRPSDAPVSLTLNDVTVEATLRLICNDEQCLGVLDSDAIVTGDNYQPPRTFQSPP